MDRITESIKNNYRALARALTIVENDLKGAKDILLAIRPDKRVPVLGITGPPGAGKSTLVNAIINYLLVKEKKVAVVAIDPTSPFNLGSLLGDRIRMAEQFNKPDVFIRSLATRGSLGGLSAKTIEIVDVLRSAGFDYVIVETVGVGQSEVEIAGLADITMVVLVPEAGDEIQQIKSGLMEIADVFVVNKADRDGAQTFANNLKKMIHQKTKEIPVFKTVAGKNEGVDEVCAWIERFDPVENPRKLFLLTEKAWKLIQHKRMKDVNKKELQQAIAEAIKQDDLNLYRFIETWS